MFILIKYFNILTSNIFYVNIDTSNPHKQYIFEVSQIF